MTTTVFIIMIVSALGLGLFLGRRLGGQQVVDPVPDRGQSSSFTELIDGIDGGVVVVDNQGAIEHINRTAQVLLGGEHLCIGDVLTSTVMGTDMMAMVSSRLPSTQRVELKTGSAQVVEVRFTKRPTDGAVFVMQDITEIKRLEAMRSDFVANVSHELRTPVSVIRANAETLLDGALNEPDVAKDFVDAIHRNSERLSSLVSDLLDLARLEAEAGSLVMEKVDLSELVSRTVRSVQSIAEKKGIHIYNELEEGLFCMGDEGSIEQVLVNLIENGVKYGHDEGNVWVRSYPTSGRVRIEIIDDGPGVPALHRTRLFERFYRVDKGRSRASGGTGLGLSIVKHLVTNMNGRVGMEPNRPTGSVFWVSLVSNE